MNLIEGPFRVHSPKREARFITIKGSYLLAFAIGLSVLIVLEAWAGYVTGKTYGAGAGFEAKLEHLQREVNDVKGRQVQPLPTPKLDGLLLRGEASIYSTDGCLGCSPTRTMANGQLLDDAALTLALPCSYVGGRCRLPFELGTRLLVANEETGSAAVAVATDTGGFAKYGRVADLTPGLASAIGCRGLCTVTLLEL